MIDKANLENLIGSLGVVTCNQVGQYCIETKPQHYLDLARLCQEHQELCFEQLIDLTAVDYLTYGQGEWKTTSATAQGYGRARSVIEESFDNEQLSKRFAVIVQLLSLSKNHRITLKAFVKEDLSLESLCPLWPSANWYEREVFDLFGLIFLHHPDMRRLLTDYGFVGHPFRKDFPLEGTVEMRFDAKENRCLYEQVSIENRVLVPKVIREE